MTDDEAILVATKWSVAPANLRIDTWQVQGAHRTRHYASAQFDHSDGEPVLVYVGGARSSAAARRVLEAALKEIAGGKT